MNNLPPKKGLNAFLYVFVPFFLGGLGVCWKKRVDDVTYHYRLH